MKLNTLFRPIVKLALNKRTNIIKSKKNLYRHNDIGLINKFQIQAFNKIWMNAYSNIPFYKYYKEKYSLPYSIRSLDEIEMFPETSKEVFLKHKDLIFEKGKKYQTVTTGGTSGYPTHFITSRVDADNNYGNTYLGRTRYKISPLDKSILLWGHSHLFGSGIKGILKNSKRNIYDFLLSIKRLSAYELGPDSMENYIKEIKENNPYVIIGYTSSLFTLSRYILDHGLDMNDLDNLKGIILTSEAITKDDMTLVRKAFNVNVILEYGACETGVIAYSKPDSEKNYHVFWDSFIAQVDSENKLLISTISDRAFPLIRYQTDDILDGIDQRKSILSFDNIWGREKDIYSISDKSNNLILFTGLIIEHILKAIPGVHFHSFEQQNSGTLIIYLVIDNKFIFKDIVEKFYVEIIKEKPQVKIESFQFKQISQPFRTIAGKRISNIPN